MIDTTIYPGLNQATHKQILYKLRGNDEIAQGILKVVCKHFKISQVEVLKQVRTRELVQVRQVAAYFIKKHTTLSLKDIAGILGYTNHSTIIYAIKTVEDLLDTDKMYKREVETIKELLEEVI